MYQLRYFEGILECLKLTFFKLHANSGVSFYLNLFISPEQRCFRATSDPMSKRGLTFVSIWAVSKIALGGEAAAVAL